MVNEKKLEKKLNENMVGTKYISLTGCYVLASCAR